MSRQALTKPWGSSYPPVPFSLVDRTTAARHSFQPRFTNHLPLGLTWGFSRRISATITLLRTVHHLHFFPMLRCFLYIPFFTHQKGVSWESYLGRRDSLYFIRVSLMIINTCLCNFCSQYTQLTSVNCVLHVTFSIQKSYLCFQF